MAYNFKCYDDPNEWYNPETEKCECFEGYLGDNDHCERCPSEMVGCLKCRPLDTQTCLECSSGYLLIDGKCLDCSAPEVKNDNCPLHFKFNLENSFNEFDLDFPHLMLRYRAVEHRKGETGLMDSQLAEMDRNGRLGSLVAGAVNLATREGGALRPVIEKVTGIDRRAHLPPFMEVPLSRQAPALIPPPNPDGPAFGRKVAIYAGCHDEFNDGTPGLATLKVLAHNGLAVRVEHPDCCGMPKFENGDLPAVSSAAQRISAHFSPLIAEGWDIATLSMPEGLRQLRDDLLAE